MGSWVWLFVAKLAGHMQPAVDHRSVTAAGDERVATSMQERLANLLGEMDDDDANAESEGAEAGAGGEGVATGLSLSPATGQLSLSPPSFRESSAASFGELRPGLLILFSLTLLLSALITSPSQQLQSASARPQLQQPDTA